MFFASELEEGKRKLRKVKSALSILIPSPVKEEKREKMAEI